MSRFYLFVLLYCLAIATTPAQEAARPAITFALPSHGDAVLVTALPDRIYAEAFRRLGYDYSSRSYPGERGILLAEEGEVDGLVHRAAGFEAKHPTLIRVPESVGSAVMVACTLRPDLQLSGWDSLRGLPLEVDYWRNIHYIGNKLRPIIPPERLEEVSSQESGLRKLLAGHSDLFITIGEVVDHFLAQPEFAGKGLRIAGEMDRMELYPYLAPQHRNLAPRLAETMRQMKAEGLFEQYRREIEAERR